MLWVKTGSLARLDTSVLRPALRGNAGSVLRFGSSEGILGGIPQRCYWALLWRGASGRSRLRCSSGVAAPGVDVGDEAPG